MLFARLRPLNLSQPRARAALSSGVPFELGGATVDGTFLPGIEIMGAAIGSIEFERHILERKVATAVSRVDETITRLHQRSPCALHSLTYYCLQPLLDYRMSMCSSSAIAAAGAASFDAALIRAVHRHTPQRQSNQCLTRYSCAVSASRPAIAVSASAAAPTLEAYQRILQTLYK